jgi:hypothetical protein
MYQQQSEIEPLGALLSLEIDCPIKLSQLNRKTFICKHGIQFPSQYVQYAASTKDWSWIKGRHNVKEAW